MTVLERSKYHLTELLPDGKKQMTIGLVPINYQDNQGAWQEIDDTWQDNADPTWTAAVTAAPIKVYADGQGNRRICPTNDLDKWVSIGAPYLKIAGTWTQVNLGTRSASGNTLTWTTAQSVVKIYHAGHYVKLEIFLLGGWLPPSMQVAFPVDIQGLTRTGDTIYDGETPVMVLRKPVIYDAANPSDVRGISYQFTRVSGQDYLLMTLPNSLVTSPMIAPVIDPTLTLQPDETASADTVIVSSAPTFNYGNHININVGEDNLGAVTYRTLIKFDLSGLPSSNIIITSATLSIYAHTDHSSNARTYRVYRSKRAWTEGTGDNTASGDGATWNKYNSTNNWQTAGGFGANDCEQTDIGSRSFTATETLNQFKDFALTPTTKADLDLGNGWLIKADTETDDAYLFYSSSTATAANRPKLVIIYVDNLLPSTISSGSSVYNPQLGLGLAPSTISSGSSVYNPQLGLGLAPDTISSGSAVYNVSVVPVLAPDTISSGSAVYNVSVVPVLAPDTISSGSSVYSVTIQRIIHEQLCIELALVQDVVVTLSFVQDVSVVLTIEVC